MSDTPAAANEVKKLLDKGYIVSLFSNPMGGYIAVAIAPNTRLANMLGDALGEAMQNDKRMADDFTPTGALERLAGKVLTGRVVSK